MFLNLLIVGLILLAIEMMIPGFGIFGMSGLACLLAALYFYLGATIEAAVIVGTVLFFTVLLGIWFFRKGPHSRLGRKITLMFKNTSEEGYIGAELPKDLLGKTGIAQTPLHPAGRALIDGKPVDVISQGEFYEPGTKLKVIEVSGRRVVVTENKEVRP
ncbi:MAG: hypothetical protein LKE33_06515 [Acidaminococcus sp.]|jgi:membrane-bound ClpP family serine protease|nr:hypothetical protein [Acidaminococcus sp.]MCI2100383.1 hypothetical protein [Acidaminococcus sp.]MCI2114704.1 hypothetical protein [Acidaminococcus sp.]MCI2116721.1 hypothetical protein [Acidaminococcus sp.]